ncbi:MAG: sulfite exporter TauE/SafE family protein, partial [Deltaproteobacteria bacterium]|nr:sulfite exporter TauE/SafE family protein [Deltaproteobacteria bacterium]
MDIFYVRFPVSGVETWGFIPAAVAFVVSLMTSMGGVSGAFLLLPFQVSYLQYTSPSVSATNFVFNIVAIPSGVYRYIREGRMAWPLTWIIVLGTLPGVFIGYYVRVLYLPDPRAFKFFVGFVLLYIGGRLLWEMTERSQRGKGEMKELDRKFTDHVRRVRAAGMGRMSSGLPSEAVVRTIRIS